MKYIDITRTISPQMSLYPSDPRVKITNFKSLKKGNSCNLTQISFGTHTGTHIDAPSHILDNGSSIDKITPESLICKVFITDVDEFFRKDFYKGINLDDIKGILFRSIRKKSGITVKQARILLACGIKIVGTQDISIEDSLDKKHPVHRLLLSKKVIIVEGLKLERIKTGHYQFICLPLKIKNADGAPARAILVCD